MKFCEKNVLCEKGDEITRFDGSQKNWLYSLGLNRVANFFQKGNCSRMIFLKNLINNIVLYFPERLVASPLFRNHDSNWRPRFEQPCRFKNGDVERQKIPLVPICFKIRYAPTPHVQNKYIILNNKENKLYHLFFDFISMYKCCKLYVHIGKPKEISIKILALYLNLTSSVMFLRLICTARYHTYFLRVMDKIYILGPRWELCNIYFLS